MQFYPCPPESLSLLLGECDDTLTGQLHGPMGEYTMLVATALNTAGRTVATITGFPPTLPPGRYSLCLNTTRGCCCFELPFVVGCPPLVHEGSHLPTVPVTEPNPCCAAEPPAADLSVSITDAPDPVNAGATLTYTITVNNAGPDAAETATLTNVIPANTTFAALTTPAGWTSTTPAVGGIGLVSCIRPSFPALASDVFTLVVTVNPATSGGTTITDTVNVGSATPDPTPGDNTATTTTTTLAAANLSVNVSETPDPVVTGTPLTYTITVGNAGPDDAASATLSNPIPANTLFASLITPAGWTCTTPAVGATGTINCTHPNLLAFASDVFTLGVMVDAPNGTILTDTATVGAATSDPTPGNNTATVTTAVIGPPSANLSVGVTDTPDPVFAGDDITYTITVGNAGPDPAVTATLSNPIPANTTFTSLVPAAGWSCTTPAVGATGTINCTKASVAAPASDVFTLVVTVDALTPASTVITDTATVSAATADPTPGNNAASTTTIVAPPLEADLSVSVTDTPDPLYAGADITYTITVGNAGPDAAANATLSNAIPANTTFVSLAPAAGWFCTTPAVGATGTVSCTKASVAAAASDVFTLVVNVNSGVPGETVITDTATVGTTTDDPTPGNDTDSTTTTVATQYNLYIGHGAVAAPSITVFDPDSNTVIGTLGNIGEALRFPQAGTDGLTLVGMGASYPAIMEIATGILTPLTGAGPGSGIFLVLSDDLHAYGLSFAGAHVYKLLLADGSLVADYPLGMDAGWMAWNADRTKIQISGYSVGGFKTLDIAAGTVTPHLIGFGGSYRHISVRGDGDVFLSGETTGGNGVVHCNSAGTVLGELTLSVPNAIWNGALSPDGTQFWASDFYQVISTVYVMDILGGTPALLGTVLVGNTANDITMAPDGQTVYVTNQDSNSVSVIDAATRTLITTVPLSDDPAGSAFVPV